MGRPLSQSDLLRSLIFMRAEKEHVNRDELFSDQYKKYLQGEVRKAFGYEGCPLVLVPKERPKTIEPVRKHVAHGARRKHLSDRGRSRAKQGRRGGVRAKRR